MRPHFATPMMSRTKTLRQQIRTPRSQGKLSASLKRGSRLMEADFDPEDDPAPARPDTSGEESSEDELDGREHYQTVGLSKLRGPNEPRLDAKYQGSVVSRAALQTEDEDPFAPVDDDDDEEDPFAIRDGSRGGDSSSDNEERTQGAQLRAKPDVLDGEEDMEDGPARVGEELESDASTGLDGTDEQGVESDEDEESSISSISVSSSTNLSPARPMTAREKVKALAKSDTSTTGAPLSRAANSDIKKGLAIQQQQSAYDRLLDARIKLQKGLTSSDELLGKEHNGFEALRQAEAAAVSLLSTIESIRNHITSMKMESPASSGKRKLDDIETTEPSASVWTRCHTVEDSARAHRRTILAKWASSTRANAPTADTGHDLIDVLDSHLLSSGSQSVQSSIISDDALSYTEDAFYQSLLRDLIASRNQSTAVSVNTTILPTKLHVSGSAKKSVDTRASKGRKIRYTVHEKLQNFMAPEDRTSWTDAASREFFGSLFGQQLLDEDGAQDVADDDVTMQEAPSLRLFRK